MSEEKHLPVPERLNKDKTSLNIWKQSGVKENNRDEIDDVFQDIAESQTSQVSSSEKAKVERTSDEPAKLKQLRPVLHRNPRNIKQQEVSQILLILL